MRQSVSLRLHLIFRDFVRLSYVTLFLMRFHGIVSRVSSFLIARKTKSEQKIVAIIVDECASHLNRNSINVR